jgi:hypothetical protein
LKKRVLVTISFSFSIRYLFRSQLIHKMKLFCEPVIAITWPQQDLINDLKEQGFEVHLAPESERGFIYSDVRKKIDYWFRYFKLKSPTWAIEPRYLEQFLSFKIIFLNRVREYYNYFLFLIPGYKSKVFKDELKYRSKDSNYNTIKEWVVNLNIDSVFVVTPFHKQEEFILLAAEELGKKMITSILSFDNIVKRGWLPVQYQMGMVWNTRMKNELLRIYPEWANERNTKVVGAIQFDFYHQLDKYLLNENEWRKIVGLPISSRPIILFAGGAVSLYPQEHQFLQHINEAINKNEIKDNPIVLFRCHPIDTLDRWKNAVPNSTNVFFDASWSGSEKLINSNLTDEDISKLVSTLYYTQIHVNTTSTMAVDGAAFNKPQIAPAYDELNKPTKYDLRSMYNQEYYLPVMQSNALHIANNRKELIDLINRAFENPKDFTKNCPNMLQGVIEYNDGNATERVLNVLKEAI